MRVRIGAAILASLVTTGTTPANAQAPVVEMTLQCLAGATGRDLRITLRNTGPKDVNLLLGITLGNGSSYHLSALFLDVRQRGSDKIEVFAPSGSQPAIAGRVDPWILPLPARSEFSLTRPPGNFGMNLEKLTMERAPMDLRLRLEPLPFYRPKPNDDTIGAGLVHVLYQKFESAWIRVPEDCKPH